LLLLAPRDWEVGKNAQIDERYHRSDFMLLAAELVLALAVALLLFSLNRHNLLGYIDGQYLLTLIHNQDQFGTWAPVFSANPLQGLNGVWYFANTRWIPELSFASLFTDESTRAVVIFTIAFLEFFVATALFAYWLHGSMKGAVASGWLASMVIFPLTYPSLLYNISPDAPELAFLTIVPMVIVPLLAELGRGSFVRDAGISAAIVCLAWFHFIALGLFVALVFPFLAITAIAVLFAARHDRHEFVCKLAWGTGILIALFASGLPQILLGFTFDTAAQFFPKDLARTEHPLSDGSILFRTSEPAGVVIAALGIAGAVRAAWFGAGRMRWFGLVVAIMAALLCLASALNAIHGFPGAIPIYYEYVLWPIYPIFAVYLVASVPSAAASFIYRTLFGLPPRVERHLASSAWLVLPLLGLGIMHGSHFMRGLATDRPNVFPPKDSKIIEFLRNQIGLSIGEQFRGRAITITGYNDADTSWTNAFTQDMRRIREVGNEHRSIGLWYSNIPTLFEFSHTIRPRLYMITKYLLAKNTSPQFRTVLNFRRPNLQVLSLLGVRYLVTDEPTPKDGTRRIRSVALPGGQLLAADEIPNPNLGMSPTKIMVASDRDAFQLLEKGDFDFTENVVVPQQLESSFTRATDIQIEVVRGGLRVRASSHGHSFLVLPVQYSHCLQTLRLDGGQPPEIEQVDFLLTGLIFDGDLDTILQYREGPFQSSCGLEDYQQDKAAVESIDLSGS